MAKYVVEGASLKSIADGFRSSRDTSSDLTLEQMAELAAVPLGIEDLILPTDYVDYVRAEAAEVAQRARKVMKADSIVCVRVSDTHMQANSDGTFKAEQNSFGNLHAIMAIRALTYLLPLDFIVHCGDVAAGIGSDTPDKLKNDISTYLKYFHWAANCVPEFIAIGNHDSNIYYHSNQSDGKVHTIPGDWLYENLTACSDSDNTVFGGEAYGGYCYRDFPKKKLRVFLLNSAENLVASQTDSGPLPAQQLWFANALKNLGSKADAADWKTMVFCHYALDYGDARPITKVLAAYINGSSITVNGSTVNFSGKNGAKFLYQGHGHHHCLLADRLHTYGSNGVMEEYDAWRLCCPNGQYNRENYYTSPFYGVYFCEDTSYPKTVNTADDVSFVVEVTNPSENVVHSFCYGAGYDRSVSLTGISYYSVRADLTGAAIDSSATTIKEGESYTGTITVTSGYDLESVVVTMGGVDITSGVYADGVITIPEVTGTVVITVVAVAPPTNLLPLSIDTDGSLFNGGTGFLKGKRIKTSDGSEPDIETGYISGYIPYNAQTITLHNVGNEMFSYAEPMLIGYSTLAFGKVYGDVNLRTEATQNADGTITITPDMFELGATISSVKYVRLSCSYIGADSEVYIE